ncbi:hypothetical protein NFT50_004750 [Salmonella enterica]|nr:hypothetical protein [Salmonella enterica]EJH7441485.1 hypothetical protein [Salmonella enterica]EJH7880765.1 hypothetical protein [Salmonella enterica]EJI6713592.1 hypothetical protein [Salmonella enterica]
MNNLSGFICGYGFDRCIIDDVNIYEKVIGNKKIVIKVSVECENNNGEGDLYAISVLFCDRLTKDTYSICVTESASEWSIMKKLEYLNLFVDFR